MNEEGPADRPLAQLTRQELEAEHRRALAELRTLKESMHDGIYAVDREGRFLFVNEYMVRNSGYPAEAAVGRDFLEFVRPEDRPRVRENFERTLAGEKLPPYELAYHTAAGEPMWVEVNTTALVVDGEVTGVLGVSRNIQQRKAMEDALRESEEKYRALVDTLPHAVVILQGDRPVFLNRTALRMVGARSLEEVDYEAQMKLIAPQSRARIAELRKRHLAGDDDLPDHHRATFLRPNGEEFSVEVLARPMRYGGRDATQFVVMDVSRRERLEARIRQTQKMEALGTLAGGIAHDFNNLVTSILGIASVLKAGHPSGPVHESSAIIERSAQRAAALTRQLLGFARKGELRLRKVDFHQVVGEVMELLEPAMDPRIELDMQLRAPETTVRADPVQLHQVVMNLAVNARDAMDGAGTLTLSTRNVSGPSGSLPADLRRRQGDWLELTVGDTGPGVAEDIAPRIFEPFFTTKPPGAGSGMGLAVVYGIVSGHDGAVALDRDARGGARFKVYLPVLKGETPEEEEAQLPPRAGEGCVLVVDDEDVIRRSASLMLRALGYEPVTRADGPAALEYYRQHGDDVVAVLLDVSMPAMTGQECLAGLRELDPEVKVVLSSGYSRKEVDPALLEEGNVGFLHKPYVLDDLSRAITKLVER